MYFLSALLIFSAMCLYLKSPHTLGPVSYVYPLHSLNSVSKSYVTHPLRRWNDRFDTFVRYVVIRGGAATFIQFLYFITVGLNPNFSIVDCIYIDIYLCVRELVRFDAWKANMDSVPFCSQQASVPLYSRFIRSQSG